MKVFVHLSVVVQAPMMNTTSPNNSTIFVNWTSVEHAVLYTLCIIRQGSNSRHKVNTTDTMLSFDGLEAGTTYCIKGTAWDSEGRPGDDLTVCQITREQDEDSDEWQNQVDDHRILILSEFSGPLSPNVIHIQMTQGRSLEVAVYWLSVQGAESYIAVTSNGQNCSSESQTYCFITPVECGQNHSISVIAYNNAGPSSPSQPAEYITCRFIISVLSL